MKNKFIIHQARSFRRVNFGRCCAMAALAIIGTLGYPKLSNAQSIDVAPLAEAQNYDPGILEAQNGALTSNLWSETSAQTAANLISHMPIYPASSSAHDLVRSALLSGGVPPVSKQEDALQAYYEARQEAIIMHGELTAAKAILERAGGAKSRPKLAADLALLTADTDQACKISDSIINQRTEAYWVKLRGFCHILRSEGPAAELTADLLKGKDVKDDVYYGLLGKLIGLPGKPNLTNLTPKPLHIAMMKAAKLDWSGGVRPPAAAAQLALSTDNMPETRLAALYQSQWSLSDAQMLKIMKNLAEPSQEQVLAGGTSYDLLAALDAPAPIGLGQLYQICESGPVDNRLRACGEILNRAEKAKAFGRFSALLTPQLQSLPIIQSKDKDLPLLMQAAVRRKDLAALQSLYNAFNDRPALQERIALAADAMGNGFFAGSLGQDIDTRLASKDAAIKARAIRDSYIAFALGAKLSDRAVKVMDTQDKQVSIGSDIILLQAAAQNRSQAETALRSAKIIGPEGAGDLNNVVFAILIKALYDAGLTDFAAQIAAQDFLSVPLLEAPQPPKL